MILLFPLLIFIRELAGSSLCRNLKASGIVCVYFLGMNTHIHTHITYTSVPCHIHT